VGILATVTMDVVAVIALRLGIAGRGPRRTGPDLIGRWIGYLLRGKFRHTDILQTPPLRGELVLGLAAHYLIGIVLTLVYLGLLVVAHATPTAPVRCSHCCGYCGACFGRVKINVVSFINVFHEGTVSDFI
jgi:hypothetical protein